MGRAVRQARRDRKLLHAIRAAEPAGPIRCAAELVTVEQAIEAGEGRAARRPHFNILAYTGGLLRVGWSRPLVVDLAGLRAGRTTVLLDHDSTQIVGQGQASIGDGKITVCGEITGDTTPGTPANQIVSHAKNGFVWAASIGVSPERVEPVDANQQVTVNGREFSGPIYVVRAGRLGEVSFVGVGADEQATATVAAAQGGRSVPMTFAQWLQAKGLDQSKMSAAEFQALLAQFQTEHPTAPVAAAAQPATIPAAHITAAAAATQPAPSTQSSVFSRIDAEIAEWRRRQAIEDMAVAEVARANRDTIFAQTVRDLTARAIDGGMSVRDFEMELLRIGRPVPPPPQERSVQGGSQPVDGAVLQAAALLAAGRNGDAIAREYGEQTIEAAHRRFGKTLGLQEIMLACANANGYLGRQAVTVGNWREILGWAIPDVRVRASGYSSIDLSGILGAVANKALATVAADPDWLVPRLTGTISHTNFHSHTVYSLALNGELKEVAPTGELKHLNLSEESWTRQVKTRGALLRLSRQDIINDDLGVFDRNAANLARKAFITREKVFFTLLMASGAGASHFTAARGNYVTGASSAFGVAGLSAAIKAFRGLKGPDGDPIMVTPSVLLVPPTLEEEASIVLADSSQLIVTGLASTSARSVSGSKNPYSGKFGGAPLVSEWLEDTRITGYSAAYWYMFADPNKYPCYEIAYLNGQQTPTVEYFGLEAEADQLGVTWRIYWDFGVAAAEWRAGCKMAGS